MDTIVDGVSSVVYEEWRMDMSKKKLIIAIFLVVVAIVVGWYFIYFTKTPVYSLNLAREAVEKHDVVTFKKHVDMESIISAGYDDMIAVLLEDPEIKNNPFKGLAEVMMQGLKPEVVPVLTNEVYSSIEKEPSNTEVSKEEQQVVEDMKKKAGVNNIEFKDVGSSTVDGNTAVVPITVYDKDMQKEITFNVGLKKLDDGTWQAVKINNFKEFMENVQEFQAQQKKAKKQGI